MFPALKLIGGQREPEGQIAAPDGGKPLQRMKIREVPLLLAACLHTTSRRSIQGIRPLLSDRFVHEVSKAAGEKLSWPS